MGANYTFGEVLFTSIDAKRFSSPDRFPRNIRINHNPNISNFNRLGEERMVLSYQYNISYEAVGYIRMEGDILVKGKMEEVNELEKSWQSDKKLPPEFMESVLSHLLNMAGFEAMNFAKKLKLPFPLPLNVPKISLQKKGGKPEGKTIQRPYNPEVA